MNEAEINNHHRERWMEAVETYGTPFKVPGVLRDEIAEETRQNFIAWKDGDERSDSNRGIYLAKRKAAEAWVKQNVGRQIKTVELAEAVEWSRPTASKYISEEILTFVKVKHGCYEIRDPKAERMAAGK